MNHSKEYWISKGICIQCKEAEARIGRQKCADCAEASSQVSTMLSTSVSTHLKKSVEEAAKKSGESVSEWIRRAIKDRLGMI